MRTRIVYLLLVFPLFVFAQNNNYNWVKHIVYKDGTATAITSPTPEQAKVDVTYLDGFGRPIQQNAYQQSANDDGKDIVKEFKYDAFGREIFDYLPVPVTSNAMGFVTSLDANYTSEYGTQYPYYQKEYDGSPFNRVRKIAAPGTLDNWAMDSGHEIEISDNYDGSSSKITDENGNITRTSVDEYTGLLLSKINYNGTVENATKYIYDDEHGLNLKTVIPPHVYIPVSEDDLNNLCYQYKYDDRNRLIEKKLPGKQAEYIIYDALNRIVATGPAYNPFGSSDQDMGWLYSRYDEHNRVAFTGWFPDAFSTDSYPNTHNAAIRDAQQSINNDIVMNATIVTPANNLDGLDIGYTINDIPSNFIILTVNYYDYYSFPTPEIVFDNAFNQKPVGLPTGSWVRILIDSSGATTGETSYVLYDYRGRPIITHKFNFMAGYTRTKSEIDFTNKPILITTEYQYKSNSQVLTLQDSFTYTHQGQLKVHNHKIGNQEWHTLSENEYTAIGRLETKKTGASESLNYMQNIGYSYNIRGWLTGINDLDHLEADFKPVDLFAFKINYDEIEGNVPNATPYYNGNISETYWRTSSDNTKRKYSYQYDSMNRLLDAVYQKPDANAPNRHSYDESIRYDDMGNITSLVRKGNSDVIDNTPNEIDNLTYDYQSRNNNQLNGVTDGSNSPLGFKDDSSGSTNDYAYDLNGNMITDNNKGITIKYNHLNLPVEIVFDGDQSKKINYIYSATGEKVQKTISTPTVAPTTTHYIDGLQYYRGSLQFIPTSEGYISVTNTGENHFYNYVFNYLDHLGNVRLSYGRDTQAPYNVKILEENHYYPYGAKHTNYNPNLNAYKKDTSDQVVLTGNGISPDLINKYKFNGMEYQDELGLNLYDMDLRDYDPAIGRWTGIDPVTHFSQSPYNAFDGNPVSIADPSGADGEPINTWHYAGSGSMYSGAGNMSSGDHMFGGSGDNFWMSNFATTGDGVVGPISMSGNTVSIYWNSLGDINTAGFDNGVRTGISSEKFESSPLFRALNRLKLNGTPNGDFNDISLLLSDSFFAGEWSNAGRPMRSKGELSISASWDIFNETVQGRASAETNMNNGNITFYQSAFTSWAVLAFNVVHEFRHRMHWNTPNNYQKWGREHPGAQGIISEYYARSYIWGLGYDRMLPLNQQAGYTSGWRDILRSMNINP